MARWPWQKEPTNPDTAQLPDEVPEEVQEYYENTRRERVGVAWLLSFATLVVTVLIAVGLFFGGRWLYRALFNESQEAPQTTKQQGDSSQPVTPQENQDNKSTNTDSSDNERPENGTQTTPSEPTPSTPQPSTPAPTPSPSPAQTPHTGPTEIPRTGPIGDD